MNRQIRIPQVRLIGESGAQVGIVETSKALTMAQGAGLDLVSLLHNQERHARAKRRTSLIWS
ncbi:MAG: hypothetical protein OXH16_18970, partial [Gemmatimonadetes bacterium]|nr:hypothetical protein [Gemmatimonadota bacterium]